MGRSFLTFAKRYCDATHKGYGRRIEHRRTGAAAARPDDALDALIRALSGPESKRYRVASKSGKGKFYEIEQSGPDLICSCPGFEYRGTCRHTKDLKEALVKGSELPDGVEEMG